MGGRPQTANRATAARRAAPNFDQQAQFVSNNDIRSSQTRIDVRAERVYRTRLTES
jgi:hypothetical protein